MRVDHPIISADSHITEPPDCYTARVDPRFRERAPHVVHDPRRGDLFVIDGLQKTIPMGLIAAAGKRADELTMYGTRFEDLHRGGWDPHARLADQDRDGVAAEILYPTVGMLMCNHPDFDFKHACFEAYNQWIAEYAGAHPERLIGVGQTAMRSVDDGIRDLRRIKALGLRGVMMPGNPAVADYDDPIYDAFWEAAVDLALPLSFHILTSTNDSLKARGPKLNAFMQIIRGCQDIIGVFIFGGVFERHPKLKMVCVEADAGWAPHFMYRMDHAFDRHRYWLDGSKITRMPSEYFREHVYMTFQDDWTAFQVKDLCNIRRLMWANDFPHSDSTWPNSQALLAKHAAHLTEDERNLILHDNVAELYGLEA
jgi:predicted TIM-barrel fold metal-dependent hydrolase